VDFADLTPKTAALLDAATDGAFFAVLGELLDDGLDPQVFVVQRPGAQRFAVLVIGLARGSDEILVERELPVAWPVISERARAAVALVSVMQLQRLNTRRVKKLNVKLLATGLEPIVLPGSSSS
jgi:hypothetical protein